MTSKWIPISAACLIFNLQQLSMEIMQILCYDIFIILRQKWREIINNFQMEQTSQTSCQRPLLAVAPECLTESVLLAVTWLVKGL